jgi:hypothetical protein
MQNSALFWDDGADRSIPAEIRQRAQNEYDRAVSSLWRAVDECDRLCGDHAEHIAHALRKDLVAQQMAHGYAGRLVLEATASTAGG